MIRGGSSGVAKSDSNLPKVPDPEVMGGCLPMPPPQTPAPPDARCAHTQCICMHTPPLHPSTPPGAERTSKEDWGQGSCRTPLPLITSICWPYAWCCLLLDAELSSLTEDGDCHPHFIDEESMARVGPQGEAQPSFLVPEPSLLRQKSFHCTEKSVGATLFFFFLSSWLLGGGPEGRDSRQAEFSSLR